LEGDSNAGFEWFSNNAVFVWTMGFYFAVVAVFFFRLIIVLLVLLLH
jgi:hypothetical protein